MTTRAEVCATARSWINTRWQHGASSKGIACDCVGLLRGLARDFKLQDPVLPAYPRRADGTQLMLLAEQHFIRIDPAAMQLADVAVFKFDGHPSHFALIADYFAGGWSMIHAYLPARRVIENRLDDLWKSRIVAVFTIPGVE